MGVGWLSMVIGENMQDNFEWNILDNSMCLFERQSEFVEEGTWWVVRFSKVWSICGICFG